MEYFIRIPTSSLKWFENGELISNPDFSNNMEVFRVGINENYNEIQRIQEDMTTLAPIDSVSGEAAARREADQLIHLRIDELIAGLPTKLSQFENDTGFTTKVYVDELNSAVQSQLSALSGNIAQALVPANIIAGSRVSTSISGNNVTISIDVSDIETNLAKKLETSNIRAGTNVNIEVNGNDLTINAEGEEIAVGDSNTIDFTKSEGTISGEVKVSAVSGNALRSYSDGIYVPETSGSGGGASEATQVTILDEGGYFTGTSVEMALQELGASLIGLQEAVDMQSEVVQ